MGKLTGGVEPSRRGGARPGSGRKPSEFTAKCKTLASDPHFFEWARRVFRGEDTEVKIYDGVKIMVPASANEKVYLWEKVAAYGEGKPIQPLEHSGSITVAEMILKAASDDDA